MSINLEFCWEIKEFSLQTKEVGYKIVSPTFYVGLQNGFHTQWRLELYPGGNIKKHQGHLSLYLTLIRSNFTVVRAGFELWFSNYSRGTLFRYPAAHEFHLLDEKSERDRGFSSILSHSFLNDFLSDDKLTVHCKVEIQEVSGAFLGEVAIGLPTDLTQNPYWKMYKDKQLTDLTIKVGAHEFRVHKAILAAHSPVFAAMFEHDMVEKINSCVAITDYEAKVVEKFIEFIYNKSCRGFEENAYELLLLAEKYDFDVLKTECEIALAQNVTTETSEALLVFAETNNASLLRNATLNFKKKNGI